LFILTKVGLKPLSEFCAIWKTKSQYNIYFGRKPTVKLLFQDDKLKRPVW